MALTEEQREQVAELMRQAHSRSKRPYDEIRSEILDAIKQNGGYETIYIEGIPVDVPAEACQMARETYREGGGHALSVDELALANTFPAFGVLNIKLEDFSDRIQTMCRAVHTC